MTKFFRDTFTSCLAKHFSENLVKRSSTINDKFDVIQVRNENTAALFGNRFISNGSGETHQAVFTIADREQSADMTIK